MLARLIAMVRRLLRKRGAAWPLEPVPSLPDRWEPGALWGRPGAGPR